MEEREVEKTNADVLPPSNMVAEINYQRFSKIFVAMAITCGVLVFISLLSSIITPVIYAFVLAILLVVIVVMIIFTLGTVFAVPNNPISTLWSWVQNIANSGDAVLSVSAICFNITKWFSLGGIIFSTLSIVFISLNKCKQKALKIVLLSVLIVAFAIVFVFQVMTGGVQWQG